jgi:hypothetical protein
MLGDPVVLLALLLGSQAAWFGWQYIQLSSRSVQMADITDRKAAESPVVDEKRTDAEHREVASSTPERASSVQNESDKRNEQHEDAASAADFANTSWGWKERVAALGLSGLYVGTSQLQYARPAPS